VDALPQISLGTAALIIFGLCAGYMIIRGLARTILNAACLTASAWVGFRVWLQAPSLAIAWFGKSSEIVTAGLAVLAFIIAFVLLRRIIRFFLSPAPKSMGDAAPKSPGQLVFRLVATLIPAALLCLTAATLIHHFGSIAEIRGSSQSGANPAPGLAERLKNSLSAAVPPKLMDWLDPTTTGPRIKLAKMIAASPDKPLEPVIDPSTGRPYPRAIIVDDPDLVNLAHEGNFSTLLRHPLLSDALKDPRIRQALGLD
jgi:hypothetical protein